MKAKRIISGQVLPILFLGLILFLIGSCGDDSLSSTKEIPKPHFEILPPEQSGITFQNEIKENQDFNIFTYLNVYNGGGVAVGDINNDGLPDLYFTANQLPNKLYLNEGNLRFRDITASAGVAGKDAWTTGVAMADVNDDGWIDIYVCQAGNYVGDEEKRKNLLFLNNGDLTFSEKAEELGIADPARSNHATFLDYDKDGDLDLYVVNHPHGFTLPIEERVIVEKNPSSIETDNFFRQEEDGRFVRVTDDVGILNWGFGLSASCSDLNNDGWMDIFVANDFSEKDNYWINQGDGTFKEGIFASFSHISNFSMGSDIADMNNDGLPDLMVLDMMAADNYRKKTNMSAMNPETFWSNVELGRHHQYMQNVLQLNNGDGTFSEIAELAGVANTDWSWTALFSDLDNDGWKDLLVTNGMRRDVRNNDYFKSILGLPMNLVIEKYDSIKTLMPVEPIANFIYQNSKTLQFQSVAESWGLDYKGFTQGAAMSDLDRDGDLDLVFNNMDDVSMVIENQMPGGNNYLQIIPQGPPGNKNGIGLRVKLKIGDQQQIQELITSKGFLSSAEPLLHFGLGKAKEVDEVEFTWPDGKRETRKNVKANRMLEVSYGDAKPHSKPPSAPQPFMKNFTEVAGIGYQQQEESFDDFATEILLPYAYSRLGPKLAIGDANGNGRDDFFIGGAAGSIGKLFLQDPNGSFKEAENQPWSQHRGAEDMGASFLDVDQDGDQDLYIASGSNEGPINSETYKDRLYLNDGAGKYEFAKDALPDMRISSSCVRPADFDGDGDLDLFVGGRIIPGRYPHPAASCLLENQGGKFIDVTDTYIPEWKQAGLVTDAYWFDYEGDKDLDLIVAAEWQPIRIYRNDGSAFEHITAETGLEKYTGWWFSLTPCDLNADGHLDFIAGNLGLNSRLKSKPDQPFEVYATDFDENNTNDIVLGMSEKGKIYPLRGRECSSNQMPFIKEKFKSYDAFGKATLDDIYGEKLKEALHYQANWMANSYIENQGDGTFKVHALPQKAQVSTLQGSVVADVNNDGNQDVILAGNLYHTEVETPRQDASVGLVLLGDGNGNLKPITFDESGFFAAGDVKDLKRLKGPRGRIFLLTSRNNGPLQIHFVRK